MRRQQRRRSRRPPSWPRSQLALLLLLLLSKSVAIVVDATHGLSLDRLRSILQTARLELGSSQSVIAEKEALADAEWRLSADEIAREALLTARLVTNLCKVRLAPSTIRGAGDGLFAAVDIEEGEIITCYPADALMALPPGADAAASSSGARSRLTIWGQHVPADDRVQSTEEMEAYALSIDAIYSVVGLSSMRDDMAYVGHLANDGARLEGLGGPDMRLLLPAYMQASQRRANAGHETVEGCHTLTIATRDVTAGEEIFVTYGPKYWMNKLRRRNDRIGQVLAGFL